MAISTCRDARLLLVTNVGVARQQQYREPHAGVGRPHSGADRSRRPLNVCAPLGLAFDRAGKLFVTETDRIYSFTPDASAPPIATVFASGVPGTNGVAFDVDGNLWTSDGVTGVGRVWKIGPSGGVCESSFTGCEEVFRVQPMANVVNLDQNNVGGVGRDVRTLPPLSRCYPSTATPRIQPAPSRWWRTGWRSTSTVASSSPTRRVGRSGW